MVKPFCVWVVDKYMDIGIIVSHLSSTAYIIFTVNVGISTRTIKMVN